MTARCARVRARPVRPLLAVALALTTALTPIAACSPDQAPPPGGPTRSQTATPTPTPTPTPTGSPDIDADNDGFTADVDCDDGDAAVYPGAPDLCGDDRVTDCDRTSDDGLVTLDGVTGFDDLADALAASHEGSDLLLCDGTYTGGFVAPAAVTIRARTDAAATILVGAGGPTLSVPGGTRLVGLTITGGGPTLRGGGVLQTSAGALTVEDCDIAGNQATYGAGVSVAPGGVAVLARTGVHDNSADEGGGGLEVRAGAALTLTDATVSGNDATWFGGGIWLDDATLTGGIVSANSVDAALTELFEDYLLDHEAYPLPDALPVPSVGGAGIAITGAAGAVSGTEITGNAGDGGGLSVLGGDAVVTDCVIHANQAELAGGILVADGTVSLLGTTEVYDNHARSGGGLAAYGAAVTGGTVRDNAADDDGGGAWLTESSLAEAAITGNVAPGQGGGVFSEGHSALDGVTITLNEAGDGGGVAATDGAQDPGAHRLVITGCDIAGNAGTWGGGVYTSSDMDLVDTDVVDNSATRVGGGIRMYAIEQEGASDTPPPDSGPQVTVSGGRVARNVADDTGGGVGLNVGRITVSSVDFGDGADDNTPCDAATGEVAHVGYGVGASFVCTAGGCAP